MEDLPNTPHTPVSSMFPIPAYILDDLCSRFIINIPEEERQDLIRIFFQIELAHWFYLDFYCQDSTELKACGIKEFSKQVFRHCPTLIQHADNADNILASWREYKMAVPTYGGILLDPTMKHCLLVQGFWAKSSWGFPKGKINEGELPHDCAIREVLEETGYDISVSLDKEEFIEYKMNEQLSRLYIIPDVPIETKFQPRTRKEIKKVDWFEIDNLPAHKKDMVCKQHYGVGPNAFFMVIPFVRNLRKWINRVSGVDTKDTSQVKTPYKSRNAGTPDHRHSSKDYKQKQQQQYAQQMQSEFQEYLPIKESKGKNADAKPEHRTRSTSPTGHSTKGRKGQHPHRHGHESPTKPGSSSKKNVQILKRDGTLTGGTRRALAYDEERSSAYKGGKKSKGAKKGQDFFSEAWANFHLDSSAIMSAWFLDSKSVT